MMADPLLTKRDVAELLGISIRTVDKWVSRREIPFVRVGSLVRFERSAIDSWITRHRQPTH